MEESDFLLTTDQNIQKQYINYAQGISVSGSGLSEETKIAHNLGYIPSARVWFAANGGSSQWYPASNVQLADNFAFLPFGCVFLLSSTDITLQISNSTGSTATCNVIVRIYLDD